MFDLIWRSLVIGAGATLVLDLWALLLNKVAGLPRPDWGLVGRWFAHLPHGIVFHKDIAKADPVANERVIGWVCHYLTGILFAAILLVIMGTGWAHNPTFLPALMLGLVTVGAGWFLLQPGMGAGWAASLRPNPWQIRGLNIVGHSVFALGLYGAALLVRQG